MSRNTKNVLNSNSRVIIAFLFVYTFFGCIALDKVLAFSISDFKSIFPIGERNSLYISNAGIEASADGNKNMEQNNHNITANNNSIANKSTTEDVKMIDAGNPVDSEPYTENYYVDKPKADSISSQSNNIDQKDNKVPIDHSNNSDGGVNYVSDNNKTIDNTSVNNSQYQNDTQNNQSPEKQYNSINDSKSRQSGNQSESTQNTIHEVGGEGNKNSQSIDANENTNTNSTKSLDDDKKFSNDSVGHDNDITDNSGNRKVTSNGVRDVNNSPATVASNDSNNNVQTNDKHDNSDSRYNVTDQNKYTSQNKAKVVVKQGFLSLDEIEDLKQIENNNDITMYEEELYKMYDEMVSNLESKNSLNNNQDEASNSRDFKKKTITQ